jgi:hypothetical protein
MIQVPGLGHPHYRMDQQVGLQLLDSPQGEREMSTVHGIAGLEGHYSAPTQTAENPAQL